MKIRVTNAERCGLSLWMRSPWSGDEEALDASLDIYDSLGLAEYAAFKNGQDIEVKWASDSISADYELSEAAIGAVLRFYPSAQTPGEFGPAKVRLLRKLRAVVPKSPA